MSLLCIYASDLIKIKGTAFSVSETLFQILFATIVQFHIKTCRTAVSPQDVTPAQLTTDIIHSFVTNKQVQ